MSSIENPDLRVRDPVARALGDAMRDALPIDLSESLPAEWMELLAQIEAATAPRPIVGTN